jgi:hypothetical protein
MENGKALLWAVMRSTTRAGRERNAMQGASRCSISSRCHWFSVSARMRVSFPLAIGPVNSNPAAVEVSAKASLAGLCRLYGDCWAGRWEKVVRRGQEEGGPLPVGRWDCETCVYLGAILRADGLVARRGAECSVQKCDAGQGRRGVAGYIHRKRWGEMDLVQVWVIN